MIRILFFAQLREQLGCESISISLDSPTNVLALRARLVNENPQWASFLNNSNLLFSVNQILVKASHMINDGDEVAFFPPVTGG